MDRSNFVGLIVEWARQTARAIYGDNLSSGTYYAIGRIAHHYADLVWSSEESEFVVDDVLLDRAYGRALSNYIDLIKDSRQNPLQDENNEEAFAGSQHSQDFIRARQLIKGVMVRTCEQHHRR